MGLYEKITRAGRRADDKFTALNIHLFAAALSEMARGGPGAVTRAEVVSEFGLDTTDLAQLDKIRVAYRDIASREDKDAYLSDLENVMTCARYGMYDKPRFLQRLRFVE